MPYCPTCGAGVEENARFCVSCGGSLGSSQSADAFEITEATQSVQLGPYSLVGVIGRGATSVVYLATDTESGQQVALKVLDPVLASIDGYLERLRAESDVLTRLADRHLVATYGLGQDQGHIFLVMEYVEGASLRAVEQMAGRLTPEQALGLIAGVLSGLGLAHAHGLVHGDLKPENIVVDRSGTSKLVDFGQVVSTGATTLGGTPSYMSPEAARGTPLEARSDLYSMGVVLYEALSGTLPFIATNDLALLRMQAEAPPPKIPDLPDQVAFLIDRSLAKDPADRPASAGVFLAELEAAASSVYGPDWKERAAVAALAAGAATLIEQVASSTPAGAAILGPTPSPSAPSGATTAKAAAAQTAKGGLLASHPILAAVTAAVVVAGLAVGGVVVAKGTGGKGAVAANRQAVGEGAASLPATTLGVSTAPYCVGCGESQPSYVEIKDYPLVNGGVVPGVTFNNIQWQGWGHSQASASVSAFFTGPGESSQVTLVAFDPGYCGPTFAYQDLTWYDSSQQFDPTSYFNVCAGTGVGKGWGNSPLSTAFNVPLTTFWTDTNRLVNGGQTVSISASGTAYLEGNPAQTAGPAGVPWGSRAQWPDQEPCPDSSSVFYSQTPAPGLACWSLIGKIGSTGTPFEVGTGTTQVARSAGDLFLGFNDWYPYNTTGGFIAQITISSS